MGQVGRPREFEIDEALDKALHVFWKHGYEATSINDLLDAMGLQKGSLYKAFGDKHSLFLQALERYLEMGYQQTQACIQLQATPIAGVQRWFESLFGYCDQQNQKRGCFAVNALSELAPHDPEVAELLRLHFDRLELLLAKTIKKAQDKQEIRQDVAAETLSLFINTFVSGMMAQAKGRLDREACQHLVQTLMFLLQSQTPLPSV
ncbi:MAG: TetR/AcrR family transcriptional regulator [Myxococcales bacterium]|nr:TetR/AcrR family transcriptional regulator [Myxococcales bacterium]MCB9644945.1 TetR/AcrR family transcriptional regulator [Myxococcales bacterium]